MKLVLGIDIGSTAVKGVLYGGEALEWGLAPTGWSPRDAGQSMIAELLRRHELSEKDLAALISTGYGRRTLTAATKQVTEITCHARGAHELCPQARTVLDIGGQDSKVIRLDEHGGVVDFAMNDKCAAGTGRFLEIMADRLGITQQQMADLARTGEPTKISSMCTVFAESEVISLIGRGEPRENIARGVIDSVVSRVATMAGQAAGAPYYLTGGLCENAFVVERLGELLGSPVTTSPQARFAGAIGAAVRAAALA